MTGLREGSVPVVSCEQAGELERRLLGGDEAAEWLAMQQAGRAIAREVLRDFAEIGGFPPDGRVLVLAGKGHNAGDALIAAAEILRQHPAATADVRFVFGERGLRPLTARAWRDASAAGMAGRFRAIGNLPEAPCDLCLDGLFGFQFRPPADPAVTALLARINALPVRLRAAVDLPSAGLFRADFTYATGSVKTPLLDDPHTGRVRYLDLGFFRRPEDSVGGEMRVLTPALLRPLAGLRPAVCDKRSYGHLLVVGGSRSYPGAVLMATLAAVRSGTGLVTAFVPESLVPAYAARLPEAMWVGCPQTAAGGLGSAAMPLLRDRLSRATALLAGPGLAREPETLALVREIVATVEVPVLLDADALQPENVRAARSPLVVTPHAGEFKRIAGDAALGEFAASTGAVVVLKGSITRVAARSESAGRETGRVAGPTYCSFFGGPVLARGGSGDLLGGVIGGLLAQEPGDPELAAARGVVWHGLAADLLARARGQVAVETTQLLEFLGPALRTA